MYPNSSSPPRRRYLASILALVLATVVGAAGLTGLAVPAAAATTTFEAEDATLSGGATVDTEHAGYSGTGFVGGLTDSNRGSASVAFAVDVPVSGDVELALRYANGTGSTRTLSLYDGGTRLRQVALGASGGWATWSTATETVSLSAGAHMLSYRFDTSDSGNVNLDSLALTTSEGSGGGSGSGPGATVQVPGTGQAEDAALAGGTATDTEHPGFQGTGFVGGFTDAHRGTASVAFRVDVPTGGDHVATLRYANGTGSTRTLTLDVDGAVRQVQLPATGGWAAWGTASETVALAAGVHTLTYRFAQGDSGNVNLDALEVEPVEAGGDPDGGGTPGTAGTVAIPGGVELESTTLAGGAAVATDHSGFQGDGFVGGLTDANRGASVSLDVATPAGAADDGRYALDLRYANGTGAQMTLSVDVDGSPRTRVLLPASGGWDAWTSARSVVALTPGEHEITYRFGTADSGNVNLDAVSVAPTDAAADGPDGPVDPGDGGGDSGDPGDSGGSGDDGSGDGGPDLGLTDVATVPAAAGTVFQAEGGFHVAGAVVSGSAVQGLTTTGARLVVPVRAAVTGEQTASVRYSNGTGAEQRLVVEVDGLPLGYLVLPATSGFESLGIRVDVGAGLHSIGLRNDGTASGSGALAVDHVTLSDGAALASRGATVPYTTYEAESGSTNASTLGPDRTFRTVAAEASGRQAVRLDGSGEYVQWTLTEPASALVLRASIPDTTDGAGQDRTLGLYADGTKIKDVPVTSRFSWVYGDYPYGNQVSQGKAQRFFGDTRTTFSELPAGTVLRLQKDAASSATRYDVDLVETELRPAAITKPAGYVDVTSTGATSGGGDDTAAFRTAIEQARTAGTGVWVPPGRFTMNQRVDVRDVSVRGAGPWYSVVGQTNGKGGFFGVGSNVTIADLMIDGDVTARDDGGTDAALEGNFGTGSLIQNVWIEHTKVGLWGDDGTNGLFVLGLRIRNTFADGVNLHGDVKNTRIEQTVVRNTGDDALAMWSDGSPVTDSAFAFNTVHTPMLGNGVGIYGGHANHAEDNLISDTLTGSAGIAVGTRFDPAPLSGDTVVQRNTLTRTGGYEPNWESELGAVWIYADTADITAPVIVRDMEIRDSTYQAILVSWQKRVADVRVSDVTITGTGTTAVEIQTGAGKATFTDVTVSGAPAGIEAWPGFTVVDGEGTRGSCPDAGAPRTRARGGPTAVPRPHHMIHPHHPDELHNLDHPDHPHHQLRHHPAKENHT
ncbi:hypothetical protein GCM10025865_20950 [Paraoerskovia sediminicola]|uniref:CBM6 domain-containing protein n=1 Tax=Paraoerskovia sediminicola TaxID=1138587 RepID=A0ABM8G3T2_9CELL|nr:CBM35 domain-containing protein [Paraoerskovia sediminicola]BDZ42796.1 hypothetical protein GCM10025865_20950 [Paraoerskovia sediminicola]